uniref:Cysteine and histidine-rich protein 1 isoform X2 n=2 Tax=Camelidae TaxID=9835 RepID=A0A9W3HMJ3_CAMBA|nr:cysteine and histidine-rich protein 1 isoform X2 [Camelus bactrianus]
MRQNSLGLLEDLPRVRATWVVDALPCLCWSLGVRGLREGWGNKGRPQWLPAACSVLFHHPCHPGWGREGRGRDGPGGPHHCLVAIKARFAPGRIRSRTAWAPLPAITPWPGLGPSTSAGVLWPWHGSWCPAWLPHWDFTRQQCTNGHLMCAGCFIHLLADARLKEEQATCPNCRCEISKSLCCRNLAVEKAVSELPSECGFCLCQFPRSLLERHQKEECQDRVTQCKYKRIGCPWHGPFHELTVHEAACAHPTKTGNELMEILDEMDQSHRREMQLYNSIFSLLSFEKIGYTEVQFRPYRTDDFITRLYYETPRFTVLNQTWVLKARVNDSERNPNLSCKRTLSFQLLLKSKATAPLECSFLLLKGPYDDVKISPVIYHFVFTNESNETDYVPLPIVDSVECNKLLAAKNINLRLFLFQIQK